MELIMLAAAIVVLDGMSLLDLAKGGKDTKLFWTAIVLLLPLAGPMAYYLFGRDGVSITGRDDAA